METYREQLKEQYELFLDLYGIRSSVWSQMYESFSRYTFCDANKKSVIAMYLELEDFAQNAKENGVIYYYGIDEFLSAYHDAVYNCLNIK